MSEEERLKMNRDYFEMGCLCLMGGVVQKLPQSVEDKDAVVYYEDNCKCSRNY